MGVSDRARAFFAACDLVDQGFGEGGTRAGASAVPELSKILHDCRFYGPGMSAAFGCDLPWGVIALAGAGQGARPRVRDNVICRLGVAEKVRGSRLGRNRVGCAAVIYTDVEVLPRCRSSFAAATRNRCALVEVLAAEQGGCQPLSGKVGTVDPFSTTALLGAAAPCVVAAVFLVVLAESALPIGFVLPGDTLLLTASLCCAPGRLSLAWVMAAAAAGAVFGAQGGFLLGRLGTRVAQLSPRNAHVQRAGARFEKFARRRGFGPAPPSGLIGISVLRFTAWQAAGGLV